MQGSRTCGTCSLCCKLYEVSELDKPDDVWCRHCRPGKGGCSIYQNRPSSCVKFVCLWLDGTLNDEWWPSKSKIVARSFLDSTDHIPTIDFKVDINYPNRWREEPYYSQIKQLSAVGLISLPIFTVRVVIGETIFYIFPTKDIKRQVFANAEEQKRLDTEFKLAMAEWESLPKWKPGLR
jgi:hypothetical protein